MHVESIVALFGINGGNIMWEQLIAHRLLEVSYVYGNQGITIALWILSCRGIYKIYACHSLSLENLVCCTIYIYCVLSLYVL